MNGTYDDEDQDELAQEGVQAFNAMTTALHGLNGRLGSFERDLAGEVKAAKKVAAMAEVAAVNAQRAAEHAEATARAAARSVASWAVLSALAGVLVAGGAGHWLGHSSGRESGLAEGYRGAVDEKAAASWANTPAGQLAYALDKAGSLALVARCSGQGWKPTLQDGRRVCYPQTAPDGKLYGWAIP